MNNHLKVTNLLQYGSTRCNTEWEVSEYYSQFHRLYYVYSGEVFFETNEESFYLKKNTLYLFPIHKKYKIVHNPLCFLNCLWFHINLNQQLLNNIVETTIQENTSEFHLIKVLEKLVVEDSSVYIIKDITNALLTLAQWNNKLIFMLDDRLDKIIKYIHNNYNSTITNSMLSKSLNLDTRYFIRLFKKNHGQTPQAYISSYRGFQASKYLLEGVTVKEVAAIIGFDDTKAFSRFFKAHFGIPPSEYKKSYFQQP